MSLGCDCLFTWLSLALKDKLHVVLVVLVPSIVPRILINRYWSNINGMKDFLHSELFQRLHIKALNRIWHWNFWFLSLVYFMYNSQVSSFCNFFCRGIILYYMTFHLLMGLLGTSGLTIQESSSLKIQNMYL